MPWEAGEPICITIAGPPKPLPRNRHRVVHPRDGGKPFVGSYLPGSARDEKAVLRDFAQRAMGNRPPLEGPVDMRMVAYMPIPGSWSMKKQALALADQIRPASGIDADNLQKLAWDAFKQVVWRDDSQVVDGFCWKRYSNRPRLVIEVRQLTFVREAVDVPSLFG